MTPSEKVKQRIEEILKKEPEFYGSMAFIFNAGKLVATKKITQTFKETDK